MLEATGDMWDTIRFDLFQVRAITTNSSITPKGENVMGAGTALQAAQRYPALRAVHGALLRGCGNHCFYLPSWNLMTFPVKDAVEEDAQPWIIVRSCVEATALVNEHDLQGVLLPRPGCGVGGLTWEKVKPIIEPLLDNRFVVVNYEPGS